MIDGNPIKKYSQLDYVGIETVSSQFDISEMEYVHLEYLGHQTFFGLRLVDYGADGAFWWWRWMYNQVKTLNLLPKMNGLP